MNLHESMNCFAVHQRRYLAVFFSLLSIAFLTACQTAPAQVTFSPAAILETGWERQKAAVIVAADLREKTSLRDIPVFGSVYFRRVDSRYGMRQGNDFDFAIRYSLAADWKSIAGRGDENRTPRLFQIEPGEYVIERIDIGNRPSTIAPGFDSTTNRASYGRFLVRAGEVINLGRIVVHMHYFGRIFSAKVEDNSIEVANYLGDNFPREKSRLETKLISVNSIFSFGAR